MFVGAALGVAGVVSAGTAVGIAGVGAGLTSAYMGSKAAGDAADAQAGAAADANRLQWDMYQQTRQDQMPWMNVGKTALQKLPGMIEEGPGDFYSSPGYQFRLDEGNRAIDAGLASRGLYGSGKALKDLSRFNQGMASDEYGRFLSQWMQMKLNPTQSLAGVGQSTAQGLGAAGMNTANVMGGNTIAAGNARASGYINQQNAITGGVNDLMGAAGTYWGNQQQQQQAYNAMPNPYPAGSNFEMGVGQYGSMY